MLRFVIAKVLGTYEWSGCNPVPPEFLLFPSFLPFSPGDYLVHEDKTSLNLVIVRLNTKEITSSNFCLSYEMQERCGVICAQFTHPCLICTVRNSLDR
jgi:hypothetical protein